MPASLRSPVKDIEKFVPAKGLKASLLCEDDIWRDIEIVEVVRGNRAEIIWPKEDGDEEEHREIVSCDYLDFPLEADVNERFAYFARLASLTLHTKLKALFVYGEGGFGKSFTLQETLDAEEFHELGEGFMVPQLMFDADGFTPLYEDDGITQKTQMVEKFDYVRIKGYTTARALFDFLKMHHDKVVVIEDCDSALKDPNAVNILKAILDTIVKRKVQWMTKDSFDSFIFTGSVVFLSNMSKEKIEQALISRSVVVNLSMTRPEVVERMAFLMPTLESAQGLTREEQKLVLQMIDKYKYTITDLNLRTLVKAVDTYRETKHEKLLRYQILNG